MRTLLNFRQQTYVTWLESLRVNFMSDSESYLKLHICEEFLLLRDGVGNIFHL